MLNNPFSLMFAKKPINYIERYDIIQSILSDFNSDYPTSYFYLITGARGTGKTVLLYDLYSKFEENDDFIVISLNSSGILEEELASKIFDKSKVKHLFLEKNLSINFHGISFEVSGKNQIMNIDSVLEKTIGYLKEKNKKILITIDEVMNRENLKHFFHTYQNLIGLGMPVYLLMTSLYENIYSIQNDKSLTFLYRAPKIWLKPLSSVEIVKSYEKALSINEEYAIKLAKLTKGYSFGYQLLGKIMYEKKYSDISHDLLNEYDSALATYSYDKIYEELTGNELKLLSSIGSDTPVSTKECLTRTDLKEKDFSVYKDRLVKKGIIDSVTYGSFQIVLPRFIEYLSLKNKLLY